MTEPPKNRDRIILVEANHTGQHHSLQKQHTTAAAAAAADDVLWTPSIVSATNTRRTGGLEWSLAANLSLSEPSKENNIVSGKTLVRWLEMTKASTNEILHTLHCKSWLLGEGVGSLCWWKETRTTKASITTAKGLLFSSLLEFFMSCRVRIQSDRHT